MRVCVSFSDCHSLECLGTIVDKLPYLVVKLEDHIVRPSVNFIKLFFFVTSGLAK